MSKKLWIGLAVGTLLLGAVPAWAATINVGPAGDYTTIQAAITAAASGDLILVAEGTYVETGQIVIEKNLTIVGADKITTIIKPDRNTSDAYKEDSSAWILVNTGVTFNLSKVTLDGTGRKITNAILSRGFGTIDGNVIKNIAYIPGGLNYSSAGIALYGATMTVSNNSFSNIGEEGVYTAYFSTATITANTYTGKGAGNWLDYAFEIGHNSTATITDNTISGNTGVALDDGSTSAGINMSTYSDVWPVGVVTAATITNNTITGNTDGINVGIPYADTHPEGSVVVAHYNNISGNTSTGITSYSNVTVDATHNWWGDSSGPSGGALDPVTSTPASGTGDSVSANVRFDPWLGAAVGSTGDSGSSGSLPVGPLAAGISGLLVWWKHRKQE